MRFVVFCPMAWTEASGGIIALHKLAHNISILGYECYITTSQKNPSYEGIQGTPIIDDQTVVIYPEIVAGNPLGAKNVVRWLLNTPGVIGFRIGEGEIGEYGPDDHVYKFAEAFKAPDESKVKGELRAVEMNFDIFYDKKQDRFGTCYLLRKGSSKPRIDHGGICIDDYEQQGGNKFLAHIFNTCELFICYDDACFVATQAAMCGCKVYVIPGKLSRQEWKEKFPYFRYGIAYGMDDSPYGIEKVIPNLKQIEAETIQQAKGMIARF